jgi:hypothetical protein
MHLAFPLLSLAVTVSTFTANPLLASKRATVALSNLTQSPPSQADEPWGTFLCERTRSECFVYITDVPGFTCIINTHPP